MTFLYYDFNKHSRLNRGCHDFVLLCESCTTFNRRNVRIPCIMRRATYVSYLAIYFRTLYITTPAATSVVFQRSSDCNTDDSDRINVASHVTGSVLTFPWRRRRPWSIRVHEGLENSSACHSFGQTAFERRDVFKKRRTSKNVQPVVRTDISLQLKASAASIQLPLLAIEARKRTRH